MIEWFHNFAGLTNSQAHETWWYISLETFVLTFCIMCIIELAGRKSINQLSMIQTVVFIAIGEVVLVPVIEKDFHFEKSILVVTTLVVYIIVMEYLQMKFNFLEKLFVGKAQVIIKDGKLNVKQLRKQRLTVDQLESELRCLGLKNIDELRTVTFESNGKIGYELKSEYEPITRKEFYHIMNSQNQKIERKSNNIFEEVRNGHDEEKHGKFE